MTRRDVMSLIKNEPYRVGQWVGFKDLTELHNKWLRLFLFSKDDVTLLGHRGSYKTTVLSLFLALNIVIYPNKTVLFFRKTDADVQVVIKQVAKILESGCMQMIINKLYNGKVLAFVKRTDSEIHTNLCTTIKGDSQLLGLGIGTSITGKHADIIITDDIVNLTDRISKAERDKTKLRYQELQNVKNRSGRFINTGTPWHKDDAISGMPNKYIYDCYSTGLISQEQLLELKKSMSASLFSANYELKHIADEDALFGNPNYVKTTDELIYESRAQVDASYGGADGTAFTIMREQGGKIYALGKLWHRHINDCLTDIDVLMERFKVGSIICEQNADKGYLKAELSERGHIAHLYHEKQNKYVKISTYLKKNWERIYWLDETDPEYIAQICDYTENAQHDDAPDSAASLLRSFEHKTKFHTVKGGF